MGLLEEGRDTRGIWGRRKRTPQTPQVYSLHGLTPAPPSRGSLGVHRQLLPRWSRRQLPAGTVSPGGMPLPHVPRPLLRELWPGDAALGPAVPVGALCAGDVRRLSLRHEGCSRPSQHICLPWSEERDETGASGLGQVEGLCSWPLREYPEVGRAAPEQLSLPGAPGSQGRSCSAPQTAPNLLPSTALKA